LEYYKQLVPNAEVTLPGSTCPTCNNGTPAPDTVTAANTWTPFDLALLVERLGGAIVATHSQSGVMGHHMTRILKEKHSASPERADHDRGVLLAGCEWPYGRGLR
jgi:hypothetical protein